MLGRLVEEKIFECYIVLHNLGGVGKIRNVLDRDGQVLYV